MKSSEFQIDKSQWKKIQLGDIAEDINERIDNPSESEFERFVGLEHFVSEELKIKSWSTTENLVSAAKKFKKGDILFARRNAYLRRASLVDFDGICSGDAFVLREKLDMVIPGFLAFIVNSNMLWDYSNANAAGTMSKRVKWRDLALYEFLLPPKEQQSQLAELLWAGDKVIDRLRLLLCSIVNTQSVFSLNNYEDKVRPKANFGSIIDINPRKPNGLNDDQDVSFLTMADVSEDGFIKNTQVRKLREVKKGFTFFGEGDTLFAKITPCMENGKGSIASNLINGIGFGSTEFHVLRPKLKSDELYCFFVTKMDLFRREAEKRMVGSAGQRRVPSSFLSEFEFHIPDIERREWFGEKMLEFEQHKRMVEQAIANSKQVNRQLINQLFT